MSTHTICFHGEIRKGSIYFLTEKCSLSQAMCMSVVEHYSYVFLFTLQTV